MNITKNSMRNTCILFLLYFIGCFFEVLSAKKTFLLRDISSIYYLCVGILATMFFYKRIVDKQLRLYLIGIGFMLVFWLFLRVEKYVAFEENELIVRQLWYMYYIPMLMIPQLSFQAALSVDSIKKSYKSTVIDIISFGVSLIFIILVLTNDFHQFIFKFNEGFEDSINDYAYGIVYWFLIVWKYSILIASIVILIKKCALISSKKLVWILILYSVVFITFIILIVTDNRMVILGEKINEIPETECFLMGGMWFICINIGLVPSNKGYEKFINKTKLAVQITDMNYQKVYSSNNFIDMSKEKMNKKGIIHVDENILCYCKMISGGYAFWQEDYSEINKLNKELENIREELSEESEMLRMENKLKEKKAHVEAKSKLYDKIAIRVLPESQMIVSLTDEIEKYPELFEKNMRIISVLAAYIKRISNIMLLSQENNELELRELELALIEITRYLKKMNIIAEINAKDIDECILANEMVDAYEKFKIMLVQSVESLTALYINLDKEKIKIAFEGVMIDNSQCANTFVEIDEEISFVRINLRKDGV